MLHRPAMQSNLPPSGSFEFPTPFVGILTGILFRGIRDLKIHYLFASMTRLESV